MAPPRGRLLLGLTFVVGLASGCSGDGLERYDDAFCAAALKEPRGVDAMDWLRISSNEPKHLGSFSVAESLAFVDRLDAAGARRLVVVGLAAAGEGTSRPALVVELPDDPAKRRAIFELYAKQVRGAGFEPLADLGQRYLYMPPDR